MNFNFILKLFFGYVLQIAFTKFVLQNFASIMHKQLLIILIGFTIYSNSVIAQADNVKGWHLLDARQNGYNGISLSPTYQFLKDKKSIPVIVAIIDTGVDTTQEDLKNILWKNPGEIPGNGKDDDGNGYVDDVYGWNFLGGRDGRNIKTESFEVTRVYHKYKNKYFQKMIDTDTMCNQTREEYELWKKAAKNLEMKPEEQVDLMFLEMAFKSARKSEKILKEELNAEEFTAEGVEKFQPQTMRSKQAKLGYLTFFKITEFETSETNTSVFSQLEEYISGKKRSSIAKDVAPPNSRAEIVGDNYNDINDRFYGNSDVMGPSPLHGTHVSGIIGAQRENGIGVDGVADNVRIMMIRALPDGDEYDKDIALAIKYAVDNGAKVINMSFGKSFSPEKKWVDEAVRYAELKDVLLVHAAGNEAENNDESDNFPNATLELYNKTEANNFITVGASSDVKLNDGWVADFSNYGKKTVDVFAPGVKIYSTFPGVHQYGFLKGTSMAAPVVSGLAALIRSYYPNLSAVQVKNIIEKSVTTFDTSTLVIKPGSKVKVKIAELCKSGGIINAYKAIELASEINAEKPVESKKTMLPKSSFKNTKVSR